MGTTLVAALAGNGKAVLLNEGDSRAYHITQEGITRITRDHSLVEDMVQRGELTREQALALLRQYNEEPFHLRHALTVEAVMNWFARELGYGEEAAFWAQAGLLHDLDFERYPEEHCVKVREIMEARGLDSALIHAVVSHGWGMTEGDAQPEHEMERVLFAVDELTGLIGAAALMRPSKSVQDMELSSLRKKFKDKKFAAGCSRETITQGAQLLGWELNDLLERTLQAMKACEADIEAQCAAL